MGCGSSVQPTEQVEETGPALCEKPAAAAARKAATPEEKAAPVREEKAKASCAVRARPKAANATFLRVLSVNDVYELTNYPRLASAIKQNRAAAGGLDCVFISCAHLLCLIDHDWTRFGYSTYHGPRFVSLSTLLSLCHHHVAVTLAMHSFHSRSFEICHLINNQSCMVRSQWRFLVTVHYECARRRSSDDGRAFSDIHRLRVPGQSRV